MAGRFPVKTAPAPREQIPAVEDPTTKRALDAVGSALEKLQGKHQRDVLVDVDLEVGTNRIPHGLGRACKGYTIVPTVADAGFAHAIDKSNPRPEREVWITVVGAAQPAASIEVF